MCACERICLPDYMCDLQHVFITIVAFFTSQLFSGTATETDKIYTKELQISLICWTNASLHSNVKYTFLHQAKCPKFLGKGQLDKIDPAMQLIFNSSNLKSKLDLDVL